MRRKKKSKTDLVAKFTAEALHFSRGALPGQQCIIKIAATLDPDIEPASRMTGGRHA